MGMAYVLYVVIASGDAACAVTIPEGDCSDCNTLLDAIWSYLSEIFRRMFEYDDPEEQPGTQWW